MILMSDQISNLTGEKETKNKKYMMVKLKWYSNFGKLCENFFKIKHMEDYSAIKKKGTNYQYIQQFR